MTIQNIEADEHVEVEVVTAENVQKEATKSDSEHLPNWVEDQRKSWGEELVVAEWQQDDGTYREKHGWKVSSYKTIAKRNAQACPN